MHNVINSHIHPQKVITNKENRIVINNLISIRLKVHFVILSFGENLCNILILYPTLTHPLSTYFSFLEPMKKLVNSVSMRFARYAIRLFTIRAEQVIFLLQ